MKGKLVFHIIIIMCMCIMSCVIRTTSALLNVATKDQASLTELPFGEVHSAGDCPFKCVPMFQIIVLAI